MNPEIIVKLIPEGVALRQISFDTRTVRLD